MSQDKILDKKRYAEIKNLAYYAYDVYSKASLENTKDLLEGFLAKYSTLEEKKIFTNTLLCPYDMELCQYLMNNQLSPENVSFITEKFQISNELVDQKGEEYLKYSYLNCVGEGLIDYNIIFELSKNLMEKSSDNGKNIK